MNNKAEFDIGRRHGLLLDICADRDLDRTGIHLAAVLLLLHCNSKTAQCNPKRELVAQEMGRSTSTVRDGFSSLKKRWVRLVKRPGKNTRYEWNWERVSAEEWQWQGVQHRQHVVSVRPTARGVSQTDSTWCQSDRQPSLSVHMNRELNREENKEENTHSGVCVRQPPDNETGKEAKPVADGHPDDHGNLLSDRSPADGDRTLADGIADDHGRPGNGANPTPGDDDNLDHAVAEYLRAYPMTGGDVEAVRREMATALATAPFAEVLDGLSYHEAQVWAGKEDRYIPRPENFLRRRMWTIRRSGPAPTIDNDGRLVPTNGHGAVPSGIRPDLIAGAERALARTRQ
jgi:hypothetical protein